MARSLKARLTLLYTGIFALFLTGLSAYVQVSSSIRGWRDFDQELKLDARQFTAEYAEEMNEVDSGITEDWRSAMARFAVLEKASAAIYDAEGRLIFSTADLLALPARTDLPRVGEPDRLMTRAWQLGRRPGSARVFCSTIRLPRRPPMLLEFAKSTYHLEYRLWRLLLGFCAALPLFVLVGAGAGWLFVKRALRPVDQMALLAREITVGDLERRIPVPPTEGELQTLARTLNAMLARLESSFGQLRTFTADAAHELKTPIATIRAAIETSLDAPADDLRKSAGEALEELGRLNEIVEKLLLLARADAGSLRTSADPVDLSDLSRQVVDALEGPASSRRMKIELASRPVTVTGDAALLRQAIHNLVENAVKYGRDGGRIRVEVVPGGVRVEDDGPGLPADVVPRLFERFYRGDASRSTRIPGIGLGLAIVKSIAEAHGGTATAESSPGRTVLEFHVALRTGDAREAPGYHAPTPCPPPAAPAGN